MPQSSSGSKGAKFGFGSSTSRFDVRGVSAVQICQPLPILPSQYVAVHHQKIVSSLFLNNNKRVHVRAQLVLWTCVLASIQCACKPCCQQTAPNQIQHVAAYFCSFFFCIVFHTHPHCDRLFRHIVTLSLRSSLCDWLHWGSRSM